jgi:hypothetical protein
MSFLNPTRNRRNLHFTLEGGRFTEGVKLTEQEKAFLKLGRENKKNMIEQLMSEGYTKIQAEKAYLKKKKLMLKEKRQPVETHDINDYLNAYNETLNPVMTPKRRGRPPSGKVKLPTTPKKRGRPATGKAMPKKDKLTPEELKEVRLESLKLARAVKANNLLHKKSKTEAKFSPEELEYIKMAKEKIKNEMKELRKKASEYEPSLQEEKEQRNILPKLRNMLRGKRKLMKAKNIIRKTPLMKYKVNVGEGIIKGLTNRRRGGGLLESAIEAVPTLVNYIRDYKKEKQDKTNRANQMLRDMQSGKYMSDLNRQLGLQ